MKINSNLKKLAVFSSLFTLASCGGGSSGSSSSLGAPSTIESLPAVTGPVVSSSKSTLLSALRKKATSGRILQYATASTGVVLNSAGPSTFQVGNSKAFCEMTNMIRSIYREAATPDKILCYIGTMKKHGVISDDIYSQGWAYFKLVNLPAEDGGTNSEPRVKTRVIKTDGKISDFKMFSCFNGTTIAPVQSEYISQEFTDTGASIVAKNVGSGEWGDYGSDVEANGDVNANGEWLAKTLTARNYWQSADDIFANTQGGTLTQGPASISIEGYQKGSWGTSFEDGGSPVTVQGTYSNGFLGFVETLGTESLGTLALGNGSARYDVNNTFQMGANPEMTWDENNYESWNGDTKAIVTPASGGEYYAEVDGKATPTVPAAAEEVTFSDEETWDCQAEGEFENADFSTATDLAALGADMMECDEKFGLGNDWIDCSATYPNP